MHDGESERSSIDDPRLRAALSCLDEMSRRVVFLRFWGKMTFEALAEEMGVSLSRVKSVYAAAIADLRGVLS